MIVAESAAEGEPAWKGAGQDVGLQIWRIVVSIQADLFPSFGSEIRPR